MTVYCPRCGSPAHVLMDPRRYVRSCGCNFPMFLKLDVDDEAVTRLAEPWREDGEVQRIRYLLPRLLRSETLRINGLDYWTLVDVVKKLEARRGAQA